MGQPNPPADPGATPPAPTPPAPDATAPPATGDGLGEAGKKAIEAERTARKELEKQLKELQARDPVKVLMEALGQKPQAGQDNVAVLTEQVQQLKREQAEAVLRATRLEVAAVKGLTPAQAARLQGTTREELDADADQLKELFPAPPSTPGTPAPDPSQGARGGANQLEAALKAAQEKGDAKESIRLKNLIAAQRNSK